MARLKRTSPVIDTARQRLAGLKSIDPNFDFGPGFTRAEIEAEIKDTQDTLDEYNGILSQADEVKNRYEAKETGLQTKSARVLALIGARFGLDSSEYEQCGGTRTSDRKRTSRTPKPPTGTGGSTGKDGPSGTGGSSPSRP
jgi:hypothetical protein